MYSLSLSLCSGVQNGILHRKKQTNKQQECFSVSIEFYFIVRRCLVFMFFFHFDAYFMADISTFA
jgi:hypothetical protein